MLAVARGSHSCAAEIDLGARSVHAYSGSSVKGFPTLQEAQRNWDDYNEVKSQGAGLILDPFTGSP